MVLALGLPPLKKEREREWCKKRGGNVINFSYTIPQISLYSIPAGVRVKSAKVSGSFPVFAK